MAEVSVHDAAGLSAALSVAKGGDEIRLAAGNYGELVVNNLKIDGMVTITSADLNNKAVFDHISLGNDSGLTFANIEVDVPSGAKGVEVGGSSNITLDHLDVHGALADGSALSGAGIYIRNSDGVNVTHSEVSRLVQGLTHLDSRHVTISDNTFHDLRVDGIRGGGSSNIEISRNYFTDFHRNPGEHGDAIQFWTSNTTESAHDIVVADNVIVRGDGTFVQGVFLGNERAIPYKDVTITGNAVIGGMPNGIAVGYGDGVVVEDNLVLGYTDHASKIRSDYSTNITFAHNTTSHFVLLNNGEGVVQLDNTITPSLPVGDLDALHTWIISHGGAESGLPHAALELFGYVAVDTAGSASVGASVGSSVVAAGADVVASSGGVTSGGAVAPGHTGPAASASGDDTQSGGAAADTLVGGENHNYLRGNDGHDQIVGGAAFDDINGNVGNDTCSGGDGDDWVVGGKDQDQLSGDVGEDIVYGNIGADTCDGGAGNDIVRGGQGNDLVVGGAGNDFVSGDRGDDTIMGGDGADIFHTFGSAGVDRVMDFNAAEGDRVMLDPGTHYAVAQVGADTVISMTGGGEMVLVGVNMSTLTGDWIFGA